MNSIIAYWWQGGKDGQYKNNWGDAINPYLINQISMKKVIHFNIAKNETYLIKHYPYYAVCGSILEGLPADNVLIWGAGFIRKEAILKVRPNKIYAVRGPLTRQLLLSQGIDCPAIYGDPALLNPLFYKTLQQPTYKLGIIPHYVDQNDPVLQKFKTKDNVLIIDIMSGINTVPDQINKCEMIASSSLHGLILADAYEVPSIWIKVSNKIFGGDFKFYAYFYSVGRHYEEPLFITEQTKVNDFYNHINGSTPKRSV